MKRIITLFMALLLLAGCSGKKDKEPTISVPKEEKPAEVKEEEIIEEESVETEETEPIEEEATEEEPVVEEETVSEDTIRPDVKEAIDAYEAFIDEYCEFMSKYEESNPAMLVEYMQLIGKLESYSSKMDAMEEDLTDAEYWYYYEVINRCNEKILKIAY